MAGQQELQPEEWERVKELFDRALTLGATARHELFTREDLPTRQRQLVEALLAAHRDAGDFLETPPDASPLLDAPDPLIGAQLGPYRIARELGRGGMGHVYLGERIDDFHKRVAIKVIPRGMDFDEVVARFRHERQVLAALEHPRIARILDGGSIAAPDGRPYLVMEYVEGEPIDVWCERNELDVEARLTLFLEICSAAEYAHRNAVVHRDLKPANVLVGADGKPVLLDFGIAKVLDPNAAAETFTAAGLGPGPLTPDYASPEQVTGAPITTGSDVYSLGVMLYELLAREKPYHVASRDPLEIRRVVVETEPPRPSVAAARRGEKRLARRLAGDLDTIVLRAMAKDPARRYSSVEQLAEDIRRHRAGRPITARPNRLGYRTAKFVQRHRAAVAVAIVLAVVLAGLSTMAVRQTLAAQRQRQLAVSVANTMASNVAENMLKMMGPTEARLGVLSHAQQVFGSVRATGGELSRRQQLEAAYADQSLAQAYRKLGNLPEALRRAQRAETAAAALASAPDATADEVAEHGSALAELGDAYAALDRHDEAAKVFERSITTLDRATRMPQARVKTTASYALALSRKADRLADEGKTAEAVALYLRIRDLLATVQAKAPKNQQAVSLAATNEERLGLVRYYAGDIGASCELYGKALTLRRQEAQLDPHGADTMQALAQNLSDYAWCVEWSGKVPEALTLYREGIALQRRLATIDPSSDEPVIALMNGITQMANGFVLRHDPAAAIPYYEEVQQIASQFRAAHGDRAGVVTRAASYAQPLADAYTSVGRHDDAQRAITQAIAGLEAARRADPRHQQLARDEAWAYLSAGKLARARKRFDEAVQHTSSAVAILRGLQTSGVVQDQQELAHALHDLGISHFGRNDLAAARKAMTEAHEILVDLREAKRLSPDSDAARNYLPAIEAKLAELH